MMRLIFAGGLMCAALFVPVAASAQDTRTPEREAQLERLAAALPPSGVTAQDTANRLRPTMQDLEASMVARNAGRESEIAALIDDYALCVGTGFNEAAVSLVMTSADVSFNDAELQQMIDFYSGPDHPRFSAINQRINRGEAVSDEDRRFFTTHVENAAVQRFALQTMQRARAFATSPEGVRITEGCARTMRSAFDGAGLRTP